MLRTTTTLWTGLLLCAGLPLLATRALGQDNASDAPASATPASSFDIEGSYHYSGTIDGVSFTDGTFTVSTVTGGYSVSAVEKRKAGDVAWTGSASLKDKTLTVGRPEGEIGVVGALTGTGTKTSLQYFVVFDKDAKGGPVTVYRQDATGKATQIGTGTLENHIPFWQKQPGDLLALEEKVVDQAMHKELDLNETFQVSTYTSLGIGVGVQILDGANLSDFMKQSNRVFLINGEGQPVWVRTIVQGGPTVAWTTSIPLGHVTLSAGFSAGTVLRYVCDDQETSPTGLDDGHGMLATIKEVPAKAFKLPSDSEKALAMTEGARRQIIGTGSLTLSGGAAFGVRLDDMGALAGKVQVGVDAGVNVSWGLTGNLELDFERQSDSLVHLRWTRGGAMTTSAGVSFLLGLYVDPTQENNLVPGLLHGPVVAVVNKAQNYTCVSFSASETWLDASQLAFDMTFDLSDEAARSAFNAAVLGDLRAAQALAAAAQGTDATAAAKAKAGLKVFTQTSTLTDQLSFSAHFSALNILSIDAAHQTTNVRVDVESLDGTHSATDIYSYAKQAKGFFAQLFDGGDTNVSSSASDRTVVKPDGTSTSGTSLTFTYDQTLSSASHEKIDEELSMAGSLFGQTAIAKDVEALHAEQAKKGFKKTQVHFEAAFGSSALTKILTASDNDFFIAYGAASTPGDSTYQWTADRITYLGKLSLVQDRNATRQQESDRQEAWDLYYAKGYSKLIDQARKAGKSPADQVKSFRDLSKKAGFDLRSIVALCDMAGRDDSKVTLTLTADGLKFNESAGQASALPPSP